MGRRLDSSPPLVTCDRPADLPGAGTAVAAVERPSSWPPPWLDLLGDLRGARILVVRGSPRATGPELKIDGRGTPSAGEVGEASGPPWDLVILDGALRNRDRHGWRSDEELLLRLARGLERGGLLVVVGDNTLSPLRAADRLTGRPAGPGASTLGRVERLLEGAGLSVVQRFGLLRSSVAALTDFDLDAPQAASAVLRAAWVTTTGARAMGLAALRWAAERGRSAGLVPGR